MKNMGGSDRNSIGEKFAFLRSKGPLFGGHFSMVEIFSNVVFRDEGTIWTPNILLVCKTATNFFFDLRKPKRMKVQYEKIQIKIILLLLLF